MKLLREPEILELLGEAELDEVERSLPVLDDAETNKPLQGWLKRGVAEGFFNASTIAHEGEPKVTLIWSQACDPERVLNINAVLSLTTEDVSVLLQCAVEKLARLQNCPVIEFHTRRLGMVCKTRQFGWKLHSVVLRKYL